MVISLSTHSSYPGPPTLRRSREGAPAATGSQDGWALEQSSRSFDSMWVSRIEFMMKDHEMAEKRWEMKTCHMP